jgi:hypothetical protein
MNKLLFTHSGKGFIFSDVKILGNQYWLFCILVLIYVLHYDPVAHLRGRGIRTSRAGDREVGKFFGV